MSCVPYSADVSGVDQPVESAGDRGWVQSSAIRPDEQCPAVGIGRAERAPLLVEHGEMFSQGGNREGIERDGPHPGLALTVFVFYPSVNDHASILWA